MTPPRFSLFLPAVLATNSLSAAVITSPWVQNRATNWTQQAGVSAEQSTTGFGGVASRGIDNNRNGAWAAGSVTHTQPALNDWWQVDLGQQRDITGIALHNRTDCCSNRLVDYSVQASNDPSFATTVYDSGNQATAVGVNRLFSGVSTSARYVRIQKNGPDSEALSLAEVDVFGAASFNYANLAIGSTPNQSTTLSNPANPNASKAIDGNLTAGFGSGSTTHTLPGASGPVFWETTLAGLADINEIALFNRGDCCQDRLSNFRLSIFDGNTEVWGQDYFETGNWAGQFSAEGVFAVQEDTGGFIATGDRVRVELIGGTNNATSGNDVLSLREVEIYGTPVPEPSSLGLLALASLGLIRRKRA